MCAAQVGGTAQGVIGAGEVHVGRLVINNYAHGNAVGSAAFSPDGARVVTASSDNTARLWIVFSNTQGLVTYVSETVPRLLTPAQRERFYLSAE